MKVYAIVLCTLLPLVASREIEESQLVKRNAGQLAVGGGSGSGASVGSAGASSDTGAAVSTVNAGTLSGGGAGSGSWSGILGSGSASFGAGLGVGMGSASGIGNEAVANIATGGTGMGAEGQAAVAGPLKSVKNLREGQGNRKGRTFFFGLGNPYYGGYGGYGGYYGGGGYPYYLYGRK